MFEHRRTPSFKSKSVKRKGRHNQFDKLANAMSKVSVAIPKKGRKRFNNTPENSQVAVNFQSVSSKSSTYYVIKTEHLTKHGDSAKILVASHQEPKSYDILKSLGVDHGVKIRTSAQITKK